MQPTQSPSLNRPEDTLPTVNPRGGRQPVLSVGQVQGMTHMGAVRKRNEDHFLVADLWRMVQLRQTSLPTPQGEAGSVADLAGTLLVVADGMGGHGDGDLASAVTIDAMLGYVTHAMPWAAQSDEPAMLAAFTNAAAECQVRLRDVAQRKQASRDMGTTLTLALVRWPDAYLAHVGDSRCYILRGGVLTRLTHDHTLAQKMRDQLGPQGVGGDLTRFEHVLVNAVGGDRKSPEVESHKVTLAPGDRLLLCTDGLHAELDEGEIAQLLGAAGTAGEACYTLVSSALRAGGHDNITVVSAFF
jgi:serine/threonine protein phosphatase PrpC